MDKNAAATNEFEWNQIAISQCWIGILLLVSAAGCGFTSSISDSGLPGDTQLRGRLRLSGSSTLAPLVSEAATRFESLHPGVRIDVQTGGSSRGIRDTRAGVVDVGMSSRRLNTEEAEGVTTQTVAWDGVGFIVHRDNPVEELDRDTLVKIYTGKINRWNEINGNDAPIVVANRAEGRSELTLMSEYFGISVADFEADVIDGETQQSIKTVSTNKNAIVYTSIGAAQHLIDLGEPIKLLPLDGIAPTAVNVQSRKFPVARPLILIRKTASLDSRFAVEQAFIQFLMSSKIDDITESLGYVPPRRGTDVSMSSAGD